MSERKFWNHGEQVKIARAARINPPYLNDVLHRRRQCSRLTAERISAAAWSELRIKIPAEDLVFSNKTKHPAFY